MAHADLFNDVTPQKVFRPVKGAKVADLKAALTTFSATSYPAAVTQAMTRQDLIYAARLHGLSVNGLA